jgi:hypothetical protein
MIVSNTVCDHCTHTFGFNEAFITVHDLYIESNTVDVDKRDREQLHFCNTAHFVEWLDEILNSQPTTER